MVDDVDERAAGAGSAWGEEVAHLLAAGGAIDGGGGGSIQVLSLCGSAGLTRFMSSFAIGDAPCSLVKSSCKTGSVIDSSGKLLLL